jgi:hypothetical protein
MVIERKSLVFAASQILVVAFIIALTNQEIPDRVRALIAQDHPIILLMTCGFWLVSLFGVLCALLLRNVWLRIFWAVVMAISGSVAWGFQKAVGLELSIFDMLSFWDARHETGRASELYGNAFIWAGVLAAASVIIFSLPYVSRMLNLGRLRHVAAVVPLVPIMMIALVVHQKQGQGYFAMLKQFSQVSLAGLTASKVAFHETEARHALELKPKHQHVSSKIVFLVDESVRPDFIDKSAMPGFAAFAAKAIDFGPSASGGVCSNYSNAILRFAASRDDMGGAVKTNPTIWQYAKAAGYRTVYIDGQAQHLKSSSALQNFMTLEELKFIDVLYRVDDVTPEYADFKLLELIEKELAQSGPVFIYANKQGAHFPYEMNYNRANAKHLPVREADEPIKLDTMVNAYRNAIDRNVDEFFAAFNERISMQDLSIVYTSDHGEHFGEGTASHCVASKTSPDMAYVPLLAYSSDPVVTAALKEGASKLQRRASHFQIAPTIIEWMGFDPEDLRPRYQESLTSGSPFPPAHTRGDIFGLFTSEVAWEQIDLDPAKVERPEPVAADLSSLALP